MPVEPLTDYNRGYIDGLAAATFELEKAKGRIAELEAPGRHVRPGHHPPCKAMLDSEAECTCGQ